MYTFFPEGMYFKLDYKPIFNALCEDVKVTESYEGMLIGELKGVKIVVHDNLSIMIADDSTTVKEISDILSIVESTMDCFITGFKYKLSDEILEYRITDVLYKHGKIKDIENLANNDRLCINKLINIIK